MIEVFKIIHNYYDTEAAVKLQFNPVGSTQDNRPEFKLRNCVDMIKKVAHTRLPSVGFRS